MLNDHYEFTIGNRFLSALINADLSGLDDREERQFNAFIANLPVSGGTWDVDSTENNTNLTWCDVSGFIDNCSVARLYFYNAELPTIQPEQRSEDGEYLLY